MTRPVVAPPQLWPFPTGRTSVLDNGLTVQVFDRPGQYLIDATLVVELPLAAEPADAQGVAAMVQRLLDEGTLEHPGISFAEALEACGAVLSGAATQSAARLSLEVPATRLAQAIPLFAEAVISPQLADADIARHVELRLAEIAQEKSRSAALAATVFRAVSVDGRFRAAAPAGGTAATVANITPAAVRALHRAHYGPARCTLILAGDFTDDPVPLVEGAFGSWRNEVEVPTHEVALGAAPRVVLVDRPGAVQADVRMGGVGVDRLDPAWPALRLGLFVLGGGFLSRLNRTLREERGYTYGVQLLNQPARHGGMLTFSGSFRTGVAAAAIDEARQLVRVDGDRAITDAELADATNYLVGIAPLRSSTAAAVTQQVAALVDAGLPASFVDTHTEALLQVTADQATAAVAAALDPQRTSLVVVGDAEALHDQLRDQGFAVDVRHADDF